MSSSQAIEQAAQTVYRNKEGKKVTRAELLEERAKERKVKVYAYAIYVMHVDTGGIRKRAL